MRVSTKQDQVPQLLFLTVINCNFSALQLHLFVATSKGLAMELFNTLFSNYAQVWLPVLTIVQMCKNNLSRKKEEI